MSIYMKLWKLQQQVKGLGTDGKGSNYKYVTGNKVLSKVKPIMNDLGLILKQEVLDVRNERIDYAIKTGIKSEMLYNVKMKFTWIDCETGEKDEVLFHAAGANSWDKGLGSALTYAERYFLLKQLHIATDEDDIDNIANMKEEAIKEYKDDTKGVLGNVDTTVNIDKTNTKDKTKIAASKYNPMGENREAAEKDQKRKEDILSRASKKVWPLGRDKGKSVLWVYENNQASIQYLWEKIGIERFKDIRELLKEIDSLGLGQPTETEYLTEAQKLIKSITQFTDDEPHITLLNQCLKHYKVEGLAELSVKQLTKINERMAIVSN